MEAYKNFEKRLRDRYARLYGGKDCEEKIENSQKKLLLKCIAVILLLCVAVALDFSSRDKSPEGLVVDSAGRILEIKRPDPETGSISFSTEVEIQGKDGKETQELYITIEPAGQQDEGEDIQVEKSQAEQRQDELRAFVSSINADTTARKVKLPDHLETGETLTWNQVSDSNLPLYLILALTVGLLFYKLRFYEIEKEEKQAKESIIRELPEFINKLVLLLNAGVVLNTAFLKVIDDRMKANPPPSYFYSQMEQISRSIKEANGSLHLELREFAKRSSVKELMRVSNIICDNISKGADLVDKLRKENELLWFSRKQQSEEKGRLAETKLTMPLVILLSVLIMVTITPALMGM